MGTIENSFQQIAQQGLYAVKFYRDDYHEFLKRNRLESIIQARIDRAELGTWIDALRLADPYSNSVFDGKLVWDTVPLLNSNRGAEHLKDIHDKLLKIYKHYGEPKNSQLVNNIQKDLWKNYKNRHKSDK